MHTSLISCGFLNHQLAQNSYLDLPTLHATPLDLHNIAMAPPTSLSNLADTAFSLTTMLFAALITFAAVFHIAASDFRPGPWSPARKDSLAEHSLTEPEASSSSDEQPADDSSVVKGEVELSEVNTDECADGVEHIRSCEEWRSERPRRRA